MLTKFRLGALMRILIIFFWAMLSVSCSNVKNAVKSSHQPLLEISENTKEKAKGNSDIQLLAHQLAPIDYLLKHPEQKGLLVNHYMGTGKTYLGLGFAQAFSSHPVIILAPRFIESNWKNSIDSYGVSDPERFTFISYDDAPSKLAHMDLSDHIILADEVHNLVKMMRTVDRQSNENFSEVYSNLRKAYKILALTGTPVYADESDVAFMLNLVSGKDLMPFNQESFRLQYTEIIPTRQFFRGYFSESNFMLFAGPIAFSLFSVALFGPLGVAVGLPLGLGMTIGTNLLFDLNSFKLRRLNLEKMTPFFNKYLSYFKFDESTFKDFPASDMKTMEVPYNKYQYSFFLHLVEGDLPVSQLQRLLRNEKIHRSDEYVEINSSRLHDQIYSSVGAGRDIGNFEFSSSDGKLIESPKFLQIYDEMKRHNEQTVMYSNYYQTGILSFEQFLKRQGYKEKYAIITPDLRAEAVNQIVTDYNNDKIRLLMLHPDVTEGISLKGTQYLHILEPMLNNTVLEQVIGRTRRFQSHSHLPKEKQIVHVRMWQSTSSKWNPDIGDLSRVNWFKRYREISYMSRWGVGVSQIDKNYHKKALNPEELSMIKLQTLEKNLKEIQNVLTLESIENNYRSK